MAAQPRSTPRSHPAARLAFRLLATVALAWIVLTAVFFLLHALPGEPGAAFEDPRVPPRLRRQLREIYRLHEAQFARGYDIVVVARTRAIGADYAALERAYLSLAAKLGLLGGQTA